MEFFEASIELLQTLVVALGAGLGVWGLVDGRRWRCPYWYDVSPPALRAVWLKLGIGVNGE